MNQINIDRLLEILTVIAWVVFFVWAIVPIIWQIIKQAKLQPAFQRLVSVKVLTLLTVVLLLNLLSLSVVFILPQEVGVVVSVVSPDGIRQTSLRSGLHMIVPLAEQVIRYPIYWQTYTMSGKPMEGQNIGDDSIVARTKDGQEVSIDCSVIFRVDSTQSVRVHREWQDRYLFDLVRPLTRGVVRDFVSKYTVDEVNSDKRLDLTRELDEKMKTELVKRGFEFDQFLLRNIGFTKEYAAAVEQKQVASQGVLQKQYEADQSELLGRGYAKKVKEEAKGNAEAAIIEAEAEAKARLINANAEAKALALIAAAVNKDASLLTYEYINKLSPNIRAMLVPNNAPLLLPLSPDVLWSADDEENIQPPETITSTIPITNTP